ncbi:MAG: hypothetical protein IID42_09560 [Planctomycetes bacterium]|nr:hypothetical protein [Planctomycetota bacterium]
MSRERAKKFGCRIVGVMLAGLIPVLIPAWPARAGGDSQLPGETAADNLYFEPIEGLTTVRHLAPRQTAIPLGLQLRLFLQAPLDAQVSMTGAIVIGRNPDGVSAVCRSTRWDR